MLSRARYVLPLVLLPLVACGTSGAPARDRAGSCPASVRGSAVPASSLDLVGQLVPAEAPVSAVVCRYAPVPQPAGSPASSGLVGERALGAGLDRLVADLQLAPRPGPGAAGPCPGTGGAGTGGSGGTGTNDAATPYLLRLVYPDGAVVVRADDDPTGCSGTATAGVVSEYSRGDVLAASFAAGTWTLPPLPDADQRCVPDRVGRAAAAGSLLPEGARQVVLCRVAGDGVTRHTATPGERTLVEAVLSDPFAVPFSRPCATPPPAFELAATYATGPAVLLAYAPGCTPEVENGSLSAQLEPAGRRRLDALLASAFPRG